MDDSTTDRATIEQWWTSTPNANLGIDCGRSGLVVLDIDSRSGGEESLADLQSQYGSFPPTPEVQTGGGGRHIYFASTAGVLVRSRVLGPGLELKAAGTYVVAPPSRHASGRDYIWELSSDWTEIPLAPTPKWLQEPVLHARLSHSVGRAIPDGARNSTLASLAGTMRRRGCSEQAILAALLEENGLRCSPPLAESEVASIARSISRYDSVPPQAKGLMLKERLEQTFGASGQESKPSKSVRRAQAGQQVVAELKELGAFVRSEQDGLYYLNERDRKLLSLDTEQWRLWLYSFTGVNPASQDFAFLENDCRQAALEVDRRRVVRVAAWDTEEKVLRVSSFDGSVYALDGRSITAEANGDHVLFDDNPLWEPYTPDYSAVGTSRILTTSLPRWPESRRSMYGLALRVWVLSTFFPELCPTRPLLLLLGEKGSGKSMTLRLILRILFGESAELQGVSDKPDGFTASASAAHILTIDNLDDATPWLRDKLARLSSGSVDSYRRLYTNNEMGQVRYRAWVAITARTPDTLRRDDLADRLVVLPLERIKGGVMSERQLFETWMGNRDFLWGEILTTLNSIVAAIRERRLRSTSTVRLADWESLGHLIAEVEGSSDLWMEYVRTWPTSQGEFLLEGSLILEGLERWVRPDRNQGRWVTARELQTELAGLLFPVGRAPADWPSSVAAFGKELAGLCSALGDPWRVERRQRERTWQYRFYHVGVEKQGEGA